MSFTLQDGHLKIPGHQGEFPPYQLERGWALNRKRTSIGNISFEVGKNKLSISTEDLINKLRLTPEEITTIQEEPNLSERSKILSNSITFKNAVEKGERGGLLLSLFSSPMHADLRKNYPETFLEEIQKVFDSGPVSLSHIVKSFTYLSKEEFSENFFILSEKLLENIFLEEDQTLQRNGLDKILEFLESFSVDNVIFQNPRLQLLTDKIKHVQNELISSIEISESRLEARAPTERTRLRWLGSDRDIRIYLELEESWETCGEKEKACQRIVTAFKNPGLKKLDLSNLGLTRLPNGLKKLPWIQELDLSNNRLLDLTPISYLKHLTALNLSSNTLGKERGIQNLQALKNLELLNSIKLLGMKGSFEVLQNCLKEDLVNCNRIEWTDKGGNHRIFSRRPGEFLGTFLRRREIEFGGLPEIFTRMSLNPNIPQEKIPVLDNPNDPEISASHCLALERLGLTELDISPLTEKDPNILSWLHRLAIDEGLKGFTKDPQTLALLAEKVPQILQYALENEEFFDRVLRYSVFQSSIDCGDRTIYYFNEIVRRMELFKTKGQSLEEALPIFRKYFPIGLIKQAARQSIQERTQEMSFEKKIELENESLEVELEFLLRYKGLLENEENGEVIPVPLALARGTYTGTGKETREDFLEATTQRIRDSVQSPQKWVRYLAEDPEWRSYLLARHPELKAPLTHKEESFRVSEMDKLESLELESAEYNKRYLQLQQKDRENSADYLARITEMILTEEGFFS